jgi:hypothetical protein
MPKKSAIKPSSTLTQKKVRTITQEGDSLFFQISGIKYVVSKLELRETPLQGEPTMYELNVFFKNHPDMEIYHLVAIKVTMWLLERKIDDTDNVRMCPLQGFEWINFDVTKRFVDSFLSKVTWTTQVLA